MILIVSGEQYNQFQFQQNSTVDFKN